MQCECGARIEAIDATHAEHVASVLKALADPSRLRILAMVSGAESGEACICDLTEPLGLSQPTVSHHMRILREAGVVESERRGKWVHFRIAADAPPEVAAVLGRLAQAV